MSADPVRYEERLRDLHDELVQAPVSEHSHHLYVLVDLINLLLEKEQRTENPQ